MPLRAPKKSDLLRTPDALLGFVLNDISTVARCLNNRSDHDRALIMFVVQKLIGPIKGVKR